MRNLVIFGIFVAFFSLYFIESASDSNAEIVGFWKSDITIHSSTGKRAVLTITSKKYFMQRNLNNAPNVTFTKRNDTWEARGKIWVALLATKTPKSTFKMLDKDTLEFSQSHGKREEIFGKFVRISRAEAERLLSPRKLRYYPY